MPVQQFLQTTSVGAVPSVELKNVYTTGKIVYVDSNSGSNTYNGLTPDQAVASVSTAISLAAANKADVIMLMPGHAETFSTSAGVTVATSGLTFLGMGNGDNRAVFTFGTDNASGFNITGSNCTFDNIIFKCDKDGLTNIFDLGDNAKYTTIRNCEFYEGSSKQWVTAIDITHANADNVTITGCRFISKAAGATYAIVITGTCDNLAITDNFIDGDFATAAIGSAAIFTNALIARNYIGNDNAGDFCIELTDAATGAIIDNRLYADAVATTIDPGSMKCMGNLAVNAIDTGGFGVPLGGTSSDFIGADNNNNNAATTNVVVNADGSILERLESLQQEISGTSGVASWASGAAAASAVSLAEALRFCQEGVRQSGGTAMAATKGVADALGTDGTTVTDSAVSVLGAIGADNNNNAFASTSVAANADGSVLERLEYVQAAAFPRIASKSISSVGNGATNLFNYTGLIQIDSIVGIVTTVIETKVTAYKLQVVADALAAYDLCATLDLSAFAAGTILSITGTAANALVGTTAVGAMAPGQANPVIASCVT